MDSGTERLFIHMALVLVLISPISEEQGSPFQEGDFSGPFIPEDWR